MEKDEVPDAELMRRYIQGDEKAFHALYRRYSARVYGYLRLRLGDDRAGLDDVFQKVFLNLHRSREGYRSEYRFEAWLFTICRNALADHFRTAGRRLEEAGLGEDAALAADRSSTETTEAGEAAPEGEGRDLARLLSEGGISGRAEAALRYRYVDELSFEEIGAALGTSPGNARQLVSRAVRRLRRLLSGR